MDELINFTLYLRSKKLRERSIESKVNSFKILQRHISWDEESAKNFLSDLQTKGRKASYLNALLFTARDVFEWKGLSFNHPRFKVEEQFKSTLSEIEIDRLLNLRCPSKGQLTRQRWDDFSLFIKIMATTGMRPSEVAGLTRNTCDFGRGVFILPVTKTTPRLVPMPPTLIKRLQDIVERENTLLLFTTPKGKMLTKDNWCYHFRLRTKLLGIRREGLSIYSLRHSFITRMLEEDVNIFKVQKIVGHRNLETTAHYTHLTTKDIIKTIKKDPLTRRKNNQLEIAQAIVEALKGFKLTEDRRFKVALSEGSNELNFTLKWK